MLHEPHPSRESSFPRLRFRFEKTQPVPKITPSKTKKALAQKIEPMPILFRFYDVGRTETKVSQGFKRNGP